MIKKIIIFFLFCFSALAMEQSQENYRSFLATLVGNNDGAFKLEVNDTQIVVRGTPENIAKLKEELEESLSSSQKLSKNLHYRIVATEEFTKPVFALHDLDEAKVFLGKIFENTIRELSLDLEKIFDEKEGAQFVKGQLCSRNFLARHTRTYKGYCDSLRECFSCYTNEEIKNAWDERKELAPEEGVQQKNLIAEECIYLTSRDNKPCINIDLQGIFERTHSLSYSTYKEEEAVLVIDKVKLFERLQKLIDGEALLRVIRNDEQCLALPILLPHQAKQNDNRKSLHLFVVDTSESLKNVMTILQEKLEELVKYVALKDPGALAQLISFSSKTQFHEILPINSKVLTDKISNLKANGTTCLYDTLIKVLDMIKTDKLNKSYIITITLFTDGKDSAGCGTSLGVNKAIKNIPKEFHPHSITFGLGKVDPSLGEFTEQMGGNYYAIEALDDLERLLKQRMIVTKKQNFLEVFVSIGEDIKQKLRIPQHHSEIAMPPVATTVEPNTKIRINEQNYTDFKQALAPPASSADKIRIMHAQGYQIASDAEKSIATRIDELKKLKSNLVTYSSFPEDPACLAATETIDEYISLLERHPLDAHSANLNAALRTMSGM